jgi:hypothetical protein
MKQTFLLPAVALLMASATAYAQDLPTVKSVDVTVELEAIGNEKAAAYWTTIADDLETAIVSRVTNQIADDGVDLTVDIEEVSLSNGFDEAFGLADTRIAATISQRSDTDERRSRTYDLGLDVNQSMPMMPADVDLAALPSDTRVYYDAMIAAFAEEIVKRLE